jgi:hypothetical protein
MRVVQFEEEDLFFREEVFHGRALPWLLRESLLDRKLTRLPSCEVRKQRI